MRSVLSARSMKTPRRENQSGALRSMGREGEASKSSEDSCTQRRKRMNSSRDVEPLPKRLSSSHVPLMASHISTVSAVRTARALVRASSKQLRMEDGLAVEKQRNPVPASSFAPGWGAAKARAQRGVATADSHSLDEPT